MQFSDNYIDESISCEIKKDMFDNHLNIFKRHNIIKKIDGEVCVICFGEFEVGANIYVLKCQHNFCVGCLHKWSDKHTTCPMCVRNIESSEDVDIKNNIFDGLYGSDDINSYMGASFDNLEKALEHDKIKDIVKETKMCTIYFLQNIKPRKLKENKLCKVYKKSKNHR